MHTRESASIGATPDPQIPTPHAFGGGNSNPMLAVQIWVHLRTISVQNDRVPLQRVPYRPTRLVQQGLGRSMARPGLLGHVEGGHGLVWHRSIRTACSDRPPSLHPTPDEQRDCRPSMSTHYRRTRGTSRLRDGRGPSPWPNRNGRPRDRGPNWAG